MEPLDFLLLWDRCMTICSQDWFGAAARQVMDSTR
jgi:hypothetical protein